MDYLFYFYYACTAFTPKLAFCSASRISECLADNLRRKQDGIVLYKSFKMEEDTLKSNLLKYICA